jgi:hypothetical protein
MFVERIIQLLKRCLDDQEKNLWTESIVLTNGWYFYDYSKRGIVKDIPPFSVSFVLVGNLSNLEHCSEVSNAGEDTANWELLACALVD